MAALAGTEVAVVCVEPNAFVDLEGLHVTAAFETYGNERRTEETWTFAYSR